MSLKVSFPDNIAIVANNSWRVKCCGLSANDRFQRRVVSVYNLLVPVIRQFADLIHFPNSEVYGLSKLLVHHEESYFTEEGVQLNKKKE